jgi:biopolymer transport protein ExbD
MIDVTFQLLLYFLLTTDFRKDEGQIPGTLPAFGSPPDRIRPNKIEIVVRPAGEFYESCLYQVGNMPMVDNPQALREVLAQQKELRRGENTAVVIRSNSTVRWKYIVEAFNAAVYNKFTKIGFGHEG